MCFTTGEGGGAKCMSVVAGEWGMTKCKSVGGEGEQGPGNEVGDSLHLVLVGTSVVLCVFYDGRLGDGCD